MSGTRLAVVVLLVVTATAGPVSGAVAGDGVPSIDRVSAVSEPSAAASPSAVVGSSAPVASPTNDAGPAATNETITFDRTDGLVRVVRGNGTITGETTLPPGTRLRVVIQSGTGAEVGFVQAETATVSEDGTFSVAFDTAKFIPGTRFSVRASADNTSAEAPGVIAPQDDTVSLAGVTEPVTLTADRNRTLVIRTELPAETPLLVRFDSTGGGRQFVKEVTTKTDETGEAVIAVDTDDLQPGTRFVLTISAGPLELGRFDGRVATPTDSPTSNDPTASPTLSPTDTLTTSQVTFGTVPPTDDSSGLFPDGVVAIAALGLAGLLAVAGVLWLLGFSP